MATKLGGGMKKIILLAGCVMALAGCSKTSDGDLEVERPVMGTVTDTVNIPTIEVTTEEKQVTVPTIEVKKDSATIKVPEVQIKR